MRGLPVFIFVCWHGCKSTLRDPKTKHKDLRETWRHFVYPNVLTATRPEVHPENNDLYNPSYITLNLGIHLFWLHVAYIYIHTCITTYPPASMADKSTTQFLNQNKQSQQTSICASFYIIQEGVFTQFHKAQLGMIGIGFTSPYCSVLGIAVPVLSGSTLIVIGIISHLMGITMVIPICYLICSPKSGSLRGPLGEALRPRRDPEESTHDTAALGEIQPQRQCSKQLPQGT